MTRRSHRKRKLTLREVGTQMLAEMTALLDGADPANRQQLFAQYIAQLNQRHPDWQPVMKRARLRRIARILNPRAHDPDSGRKRPR